MYEVNIYPLHFTFIHVIENFLPGAVRALRDATVDKNPFVKTVKPPVLKTLKPKNRIANRELGFEQKMTSE
jgi:hypothetical protein